MTDIEHLIIAVEAYPCLWDTNYEDYHNRDLKEMAWQAIAKEIYSEWETYEGIKKTSTCKLIIFIKHILIQIINYFDYL